MFDKFEGMVFERFRAKLLNDVLKMDKLFYVPKGCVAVWRKSIANATDKRELYIVEDQMITSLEKSERKYLL